MNKLRLYIKILLFILWSLPLVTLQSILLMFYRGPLAYKIPRLWHTGLCWVFGLKIRVIGQPMPTQTPVMFISNHISYLDILAMGSVLEASFVAKNDVADWPVFGFLSTLQQTAFISRDPRHALREKHSLQSYLAAGKSIILFPEGTTDDGQTILPFKSSLFSLALEHQLTKGTLLIQPFSMRILPKPGPNGHQDAAAYAWAFFDDTPMPTHLMRFATGQGCVIEFVFHTPVDPKAFEDRKALCRTVQYMVNMGHTTGAAQTLPTDENLASFVVPPAPTIPVPIS